MDEGGEGGEYQDRLIVDSVLFFVFLHMPKTMRHFVMANGETIIQVNGVGPFDITMSILLMIHGRKRRREVSGFSRIDE